MHHTKASEATRIKKLIFFSRSFEWLSPGPNRQGSHLRQEECFHHRGASTIFASLRTEVHVIGLKEGIDGELTEGKWESILVRYYTY